MKGIITLSKSQKVWLNTPVDKLDANSIQSEAEKQMQICAKLQSTFESMGIVQLAQKVKLNKEWLQQF